jgi:3',5'-cyclic AMP phosphodiesterase CpdA
MKIRVLSDLHLEHDMPEDVPAAAADLIVLAGDIHNHAHGLRWAAATLGRAAPGTPIVYVPGNHEYYEGEFDAVESLMRETAAGTPHLHFLNGDSIADPQGRWRVLGTTLWTDFALFGASPAALALAHEAAARCMFDYHGIIRIADPASGGSRAFATHDALDLHRHARRWLDQQLRQPFAGFTIVVTHHAPHPLSLAPRYADDLASAGFITDLSELCTAPVALWIHGHTHTSFDYTVGATRVVCNPRGYVDRVRERAENPQFAWDHVVEL